MMKTLNNLVLIDNPVSHTWPCDLSSQIMALETQVSALKEDLEKEHQRWRSAQANYERQVIVVYFFK